MGLSTKYLPRLTDDFVSFAARNKFELTPEGGHMEGQARRLKSPKRRPTLCGNNAKLLK